MKRILIITMLLGGPALADTGERYPNHFECTGQVRGVETTYAGNYTHGNFNTRPENSLRISSPLFDASYALYNLRIFEHYWANELQVDFVGPLGSSQRLTITGLFGNQPNTGRLSTEDASFPLTCSLTRSGRIRMVETEQILPPCTFEVSPQQAKEALLAEVTDTCNEPKLISAPQIDLQINSCWAGLEGSWSASAAIECNGL